MFFTSGKAERELGYRARPHLQALSDAIAWFSAHGYLRLPAAERRLGIGGSTFT
jgi:dihydroflavonol-4-reductase